MGGITLWGLCYEKPYKINTIVSSTAFDINALNLMPGIIFLEMILVWLQ